MSDEPFRIWHRVQDGRSFHHLTYRSTDREINIVFEEWRRFPDTAALRAKTPRVVSTLRPLTKLTIVPPMELSKDLQTNWGPHTTSGIVYREV